jgi:hypothetical protein
MSKRLMLIAAGALAVLAFTALPGVASAAEWECETAGGAICGSFSGTNPTTSQLTEEGSSTVVPCTSHDTTGKYTTKTTGEVQILFDGCGSKEPNGSCTSAGQPAGTVQTFTLTFHNVMLEGTGQSPAPTPGVLITPNATNNEIASYTCGGFFTLHVRGNGVLGDLTKSCGSETPAGTNIATDFESVATGTQKWTQVETAGTKFDLTATETVGGFDVATRTASLDEETSVHFGSATKITCP